MQLSCSRHYITRHDESVTVGDIFASDPTCGWARPIVWNGIGLGDEVSVFIKQVDKDAVACCCFGDSLPDEGHFDGGVRLIRPYLTNHTPPIGQNRLGNQLIVKSQAVRNFDSVHQFANDRAVFLRRPQLR